VIEVNLNAQFRCAGSEAFVRWVEHFLGLTGEPPIAWDSSDPFEFRIVDSPQELEMWLQSKSSKGFTARMSAGFCWPWSDPLPDGTLVEDVRVGNWSRPWNARPGKKAKDAPSASYWAHRPARVQSGWLYLHGTRV
jgi:hypothetical protein